MNVSQSEKSINGNKHRNQHRRHQTAQVFSPIAYLCENGLNHASAAHPTQAYLDRTKEKRQFAQTMQPGQLVSHFDARGPQELADHAPAKGRRQESYGRIDANSRNSKKTTRNHGNGGK